MYYLRIKKLSYSLWVQDLACDYIIIIGILHNCIPMFIGYV